ncbi:MAG TPA: tRNA (adenosine(37)-N6)-threonylcarbamoyltransferase complex ATPase subunit type 1 TsaE [Dehalococcoidia bacterium]
MDETRALGERLGALLEPGDVVLLQGPLGAGKTAMTQGIGRGTGSNDLVNSPTFVLINEYRGRVKLYHVDLYRLEDPDEIVQLDLPGYTSDGALIVEWPERGAGLLPEEHLHVAIEHDGEGERRITLTAFGERPARLLRALSGEAVSVGG